MKCAKCQRKLSPYEQDDDVLYGTLEVVCEDCETEETMEEKDYRCEGCGELYGFRCHADACYNAHCPKDEYGDADVSQFQDVKIVVLNDGETYSDIRGASILRVDWAAWEDEGELERAIKAVSSEDKGASVRLSTGGEVVKTDWLDERLFYDAE